MARVLVIDDDGTIRSLLCELLLDEGYEVTSAPHGAEGMERLLEAPPDVVLLDLMMPVMDGEMFVHACRATEAGARAEIVLISASTDTSKIVKRLAPFHVRHWLGKPIDLDRLLTLVATLVEERQQTVAPSASWNNHRTECTNAA